MKVKVGQLRQVIREEVQRIHEMKTIPVVVTSISQADVSAWDEAARTLKLKSFLKFVPGANGVDVVFQGWGTPARAKREGEKMVKKLQKAVGTVSASRAAEKPVDDAKIYKVLSHAFTYTMGPEDVSTISYQLMKNGVRMHDDRMDAGIGASELAQFGVTPRQLADWLGSHGARPDKPKRRTTAQRAASRPYYD